MKYQAVSTFVLVLAACTIGCGMLMPQAGAGSPGASPGASYTVPKESQELVRKSEIQAYAQADTAMDEELDKREKEALKALRVALGKETYSQGLPPPESSSNILKALKAAKLKMRVEAVQDADGKAVNDDFVQLKDSGTERIQQLSRKIAERKASPSEMKEVQAYSKHIMKVNDLKMQVLNVSMATMQSNTHVQTSSLQTMLRVSGLVRSRKLYDMDLNAEDYGLVKRGLERQKRAEAIAATTLAMLAAYQAVINDNCDPKALDVIAGGALSAFPVKPEVTDADAKAYVSALGEGIQKVKAKYEAMLRKVHGDARYERQFKQGIDGMFAQAEGAQSQKSITQISADANNKYYADIAKCRRGEPPDPGSSVAGPTCKAVFKAAQTGDTSELLPAVKQAFEATGGANGVGATGGGVELPKGAKSAVGLASAVATGDVGGALDAAGKSFPADSTVGASLQGIAALKRGDARGAIHAALTFVPVPGLKDVFGLASKLLFGG